MLKIQTSVFFVGSTNNSEYSEYIYIFYIQLLTVMTAYESEIDDT